MNVGPLRPDDEIDRRSLLRFGRRVFRGKFQVNWHHELMADYLDDFAAGKITNLMIFAPPRHSKSEFASRLLPAKMMGENPNLRVLACSSLFTIAEARKVELQNLIEGPEYQSLVKLRVRQYPGFLEIANHFGEYWGAGVGGALSSVPIDVGIIDDPVKAFGLKPYEINPVLDQSEKAELERDRLWEWYDYSFSQRLVRNARRLVVASRTYKDDLCGRILKKARQSGEQWVVLRLPAIADDLPRHPRDVREVGEPLWPEKHNIEKLLKIKSGVGEQAFNALYQGAPYGEECA